MKHVMVVGTAEPQDFQLTSDGVALVGTGFTVALEWRTEGLTAPQISGLSSVVANWLTQAGGTVRVTGGEFMLLGNYYGRFVVVDGAAKDGYVPNDADAFLWRVVRV